MVAEILTLRSLREANRPLWYRSFPFHAGLYLVAFSLAIVMAAAAWLAAGGTGEGVVVGVANRTVRWVGSAGFILSLAGAAGLLHRRLTDADLRAWSTPGDYANLLFFIGAFGLASAGCATAPTGAGVVVVAAGLMRWDTSVHVQPLLGVGLTACALLAAYIPFTHMSHFIGKYFTYHSVRWDDASLGDNRKLAARMTEYLTYRPRWSAPHVGAGPARTWASLASSTAQPPEDRP